MNNIQGEENIWALFQPDIFLPAQYLDSIHPNSNSTPEIRLMMVVLADALYCFQKYCFASDKKSKALFEEAEDWIRDEDSPSTFSFENICDHLDFDADRLRRILLRWRERQLRSCPAIAGDSVRKRRTPVITVRAKAS